MVYKLISMNFRCFLVKIVRVLAIFEREYQNLVKVACKTCKILFYGKYIPQFLEKLESWFVRLNTPLNTCRPMYTYTQKFLSNPLFGSSVVQPVVLFSILSVVLFSVLTLFFMWFGFCYVLHSSIPIKIRIGYCEDE